MSTNFYMMATNKEFVEKYFKDEYELVDVPYFGYEIHIGKRSGGWNPLFRAHKNAYGSVEEMINFIKDNHDDIRIFDEYSKEITLDELIEGFVKWGERQEKRIIHYDDIVGDIQAPIDHCELERIQLRESYYPYKRCYKDKDGYEFLDAEYV